MSAPKLTERIVSELLREKHTKTGNGGGGEYAYMAGVRNGAGFDATRTFDGLAMSLWPSRGLRVEVFEIKVSRSDWQRELAKPDKAEDACKIADRFWVVAPVGCVHDGELPPTWGLIEVTGDGDGKPWKLRTKMSAPNLGTPTATPLDRGLVVGMLRSVPGAIPGGKVEGPTDRALAKARSEGYEQGIEEQKRQGGWQAQRDAADAAEWRALTDGLRDLGTYHHKAADLLQDMADVTAKAEMLRQIGFVREQLIKTAAQLKDAS